MPKIGRPRGKLPALGTADREASHTEAERARFEQLCRDSTLEHESAKRELALDVVSLDRQLAEIDARALAAESLLDDPKHKNASISNRRRLLERLHVVGEKPPADPLAILDVQTSPPSPPPPTKPAPSANDRYAFDEAELRKEIES